MSIRAKVIYTLSGLLKHNSFAVNALDLPEADGWTKFRIALQGKDTKSMSLVQQMNVLLQIPQSLFAEKPSSFSAPCLFLLLPQLNHKTPILRPQMFSLLTHDLQNRFMPTLMQPISRILPVHPLPSLLSTHSVSTTLQKRLYLL